MVTATVGPGRFIPARLLGLALAVAAVPPAAFGQARTGAPIAPAAPLAAPVPDQRSALRMVWSMMAAVDHANRAGNYSVLRDLGTPAFQANNSPARLGAIFANLRQQGGDLSETLVVTPTWEFEPRMLSPTVLRLRGAFPLRPSAILFDLLFTWDRGWRLEGIAVQAAQPVQ